MSSLVDEQREASYLVLAAYNGSKLIEVTMGSMYPNLKTRLCRKLKHTFNLKMAAVQVVPLQNNTDFLVSDESNLIYVLSPSTAVKPPQTQNKFLKFDSIRARSIVPLDDLTLIITTDGAIHQL